MKKNKLENGKKIKTALLCGGMVIIGVGIGYLMNGTKIPTIKDGSEVVAAIKGKKFTANALYAELKETYGQGTLVSLIDEFIAGKETNEEDIKEAEDYADSYIENLKSQYESYGESFDDALTQAGFESVDAYRDLVVKDYLKNIVGENYVKANNFTDKQIKKHYDENIEGSMVVKYILVQPETTEEMTDDEVKKAEEAALKEANEIIAKLKKGENFEELAKKHSDDATTASEGGLYNGFTKDEVVEEFWNASVKLKDGKYTTAPVESSYGYFVIQRVKQNEKPSLEDSKEDILDALFTKASEEDANLLAKAWVELRENYKLDIVDTEIKKAYKKIVKSYNEK